MSKRLSEEDMLYVKEMKIWLEQQRNRLSESEQCAKTQLKLHGLEKEQQGIICQRVKMGMAEYQDWRKNHGMKPIALSRFGG